MNLPANTSAYVAGAIGGAILVAIVGFNWGGWVTGGTSARNAAVAAHEAVVAALAPVCAERFRGQNDAETKIKTLAAVNSWDRGDLIARSGYAAMAGSKTSDPDVARACGELLTASTPKG